LERLVLWHRVFPPTRPEHDVPDAVAAWVRAVVTRLTGAGGTLLGRLGGAACVSFELPELTDALDVALAILDDAEALDSPPGGLRVAIGVATGDVERVFGANPGDAAFVGAAIDRAQLLANRARRGELVLDQDTRDVASATFLYGRSVGTGAAALRGTTIDRAVPHRATCRFAIAHLEPAPVAPNTKEALAGVADLAGKAEGTDRVALRGPSGAGADGLLRDLEETFSPTLVLRFGGVPGALEPIGSLRLALLRTFGRPETIADGLGAAGEVLSKVAVGEQVPVSQVAGAFAAVLKRQAKRPWLVFDPLPSVDLTTLELVTEVTSRIDALLFVRAPVDAPLPGSFARVNWEEYVMPSLRLEDAKAIAKVVLGDSVDEVVRRVAVLGGDTPLGVVEAARTMVASGDLVHDGESFVWRQAPRGGVRAIPVETLIQERLGALEEQPLRMLEAICVAPPGTPRLIIAGVAERDGLSSVVRRDATSRLRQEALIETGAQLSPSSEVLRRLVLRAMPPGRAAELYRYLAEGMASSSMYGGALVKASLGYYLNEGGQPEDAAAQLLAAADVALECGYRRAARRLAASAVQMDHRQATRAEATRISRAAAHDDSAADLADEGRVSQVAVSALLAGDIEKVERTIETAIAEGRDLAAADRMRAMASLAKGDTNGAMAAFARIRESAGDDQRQIARSALTLAWILLHSARAEDSIRAALSSLAASRRLKDPRGEAAAMHTLAAAYRALGRRAEADVIADASPA